MVSYLAIITTREVIKAKVLNFKIHGVQFGLIPWFTKNKLFCLLPEKYLVTFSQGVKRLAVFKSTPLKKLKTLTSILIQPENSPTSGNKREPNILNLSNKLYEPMKRAVIMNTSFALVKIHMEMTKYDINFSDNCNKVLVYSNHDKRVVLCKLSAAIILSFMTWESFDQLLLLSVSSGIPLVTPLSC